VVEHLAAYGRDLGVAFQIADDVLDLGGDPVQTGKTLGTDIEQRKLTLPVIRALAELPAPDAARLRTALTRGAAGDVADLLGDGPVESARTDARRLAAAARRALTGLPATPYRAALEQLADWAVRRNH
jgi:octaprenyl-diphosphate synthase